MGEMRHLNKINIMITTCQKEPYIIRVTFSARREAHPLESEFKSITSCNCHPVLKLSGSCVPCRQVLTDSGPQVTKSCASDWFLLEVPFAFAPQCLVKSSSTQETPQLPSSLFLCGRKPTAKRMIAALFYRATIAHMIRKLRQCTTYYRHRFVENNN